MAYTWRYLRRLLPDGPANIPDVTATFERATLQGFYLSPINRRHEHNHTHLVLPAAGCDLLFAFIGTRFG